MVVESKREQWIDVLKALACILITNSHCRDIYPWYFLAVGGGFGNALFFAISGYLLVNVNDRFGMWYLKRVKRIVPTIIVVALFDCLILGNLSKFLSGSMGDTVLYYPMKYWFVTAILIYYVVYYFIIKFHAENVSWIIWALGYIILYIWAVDTTVFSVELEGFSPFKVYFYFGVFLSGAILKNNKEKIQGIILKNKKKVLCILTIFLFMALVAWGGIYALIFALNKAYKFQFMIHFAVLVFCICALLIAWNILEKSNKVIKTISDATLEIYLIQVTTKYFFPKLSFPVNWVAFWTTAFMGGILLNRIMRMISDGCFGNRRN